MNQIRMARQGVRVTCFRAGQFPLATRKRNGTPFIAENRGQISRRASPGGGGYLSGCTPPEVGQRALKKIARKIPRFGHSENGAPADPREAALLDELDAMGLSRVMLQVAHAIGFDNFMSMWRILDGAHEAIADNDSGIYIRLQRLSAYRRYQRNRFIEAMAAVGMSHPEISRSVKRDLGEDVSDRHIWRLMAGGRVKP